MLTLVAFRRRPKDASLRSRAWPPWAHGLAAGIVLTIAATGCGDERGVQGADPSLGVVAVVENVPLSPHTPRLSVASEPLLEVGMVDGPDAYLFHGIRGVTRLDDGSVVVVDGSSQELRSFTPEGRHGWTVGGRGGGPGEFREAVSLHRLPGDTLILHDVTARRLTYFTPRGERLQDIPFDVDPGRGALVGVFPDGSLLLAQFDDGRPADEGEVDRGVVRYTRYRPHGRSESTALFEGPWREFTGVVVGTRLVKTRLPYGRSGTARLLGWRIYAGETGVHGFEVRDSTGSLRLRAQLPYRARPVSDADIEVVLRTRRAVGTPAGTVRSYERLRYPATHPAWDQMQIRPSGEVWLRTAVTPADRGRPAEWLVFDRNGHFVAIVETPPNLAVREVGEDYLLGVVRSDLGVEVVQVFGLDSLTLAPRAANGHAG
jgi:hypothetical protein